MEKYFVNKNAQVNGDHEVHTSNCSFVPIAENRIDLGYHTSCHSAVRKAKEYYSKSNGCYYCCRACHTG